MISLQQRLGLFIGLGLALLLLAAWLAVGMAVRRVGEEYIAMRLEHDAESLLAATSVEPEPQVNRAFVGVVYLRPYSGHYYVVEIGEWRFRSRSLWDADLIFPSGEGEPSVGRLTHIPGPQEQSLLLFQRRYERQGRVVVITVGENLAPLEKQLQGFQRKLAIIFSLALIAMLIGQYLLVRRGLSPLQKLRGEVARLEQGKVSRIAENAPAEVAPLVHEINHLLRVTAQRLERSRHALGNLAHALKTPLSLLVQTAERGTAAMPAESSRQIREQADRIGALVERELKRARLAGAAAPGQYFEPARELPYLARAIEGIYAGKGLTVEWRVPASKKVALDRDDMLELLGNLLDNAGKWAQSRVRVSVEESPGLVLLVEDDGPGCPEGLLEQLTGRGVRLDEESPGSGLGLSIVQTIVADYGGTLRLGRSAGLGGFLAEVRLPAPDLAV